MLITIKTLQQESFTVEVDPNQTIKSMKEKIEQVKGKDYTSKYQKLMYAGKILADNNRLCDYNIDEKKFLIILVKKPKAALSRDCDDDEGEGSESQQDGHSRAEADHNAPSRSDSHHEHDARQEEIISQIVEMGYERGVVERALRASFFNPDRAVEYLLSGLFLSNEDQAMSASSASADEAEQETSNSFLSEDDLHRMQEAIQQHTDQLNNASSGAMNLSERPLLSSSHREAVFHLLNEQSREAEADQQSNNSLHPRNRTPQDQEAIDRLKQLGFPEYQAMEAYFACEKNENSAADFLLSQNYD